MLVLHIVDLFFAQTNYADTLFVPVSFFSPNFSMDLKLCDDCVKEPAFRHRLQSNHHQDYVGILQDSGRCEPVQPSLGQDQGSSI